jgi:hypothetical protein
MTLYAIILGTEVVKAAAMNARMGINYQQNPGGAMPSQQYPRNQEVMATMQQLQERLSDSPRDGQCDEVAMQNRVIEGVTMVPQDPLQDQIRQMEMRNKCIHNKMKLQKEFKRKVDTLVRETIRKGKNMHQESSKKCIQHMDKASHDCFVKNVLKELYTSPVWKVTIHDNVSQLWYDKMLVMMFVLESIGYDISSEEKECFTFFPTSSVSAEENALGHVLSLTGKPLTGKAHGSGSECRPCTDFVKGEKNTLEGTGMKCSNSCDPSNILFENSNFVRVNKNGEKPSKKQKNADSD